MPWRKTEPMNEKIKFIATYLEGEFALASLCEDYGISRKTGYKWIERYEAHGVDGLRDRSRAPLSHPNRITKDVVDKILKLRKRHPHWGPKKLRVLMMREGLENAPAASTIGGILKKEGLIKKRKRRLVSSPYQNHLESYTSPNAIWCADFKGHFPVAGNRCHPLTISDGMSRYLIRCKGLRRPLHNLSRKVFESAFIEYGLPATIRTDNGAPFSTLAPGGLSRLAIWWIRLGITPERIMPGRPDQNGRHERMHRTLKNETASPPKNSMRSQQRSFDKFIADYNFTRPHEGLNLKVPGDIYKPSNREYPSKLPKIEYEDHFAVAKVYPNGVISFNHTQWLISACLKGELVGLKEVGEGRWKVYFGHIPIGILDIKTWRDKGCRQFGKLIRFNGYANENRRKRIESPTRV